MVGLLVTLAGGVYLAATLVSSFSQATHGVELLRQELKQQELRHEQKQQELRREVRQDIQELKQELVSRLDQVLAKAYDKQLDNVEAVVFRGPGTQQSST